LQKISDELKNEILKKEIGKIGALEGALGGFIGGGILSSLAGAAGAQWAANKLPSIEYKDSMSKQCTVESVIETALSVIANMPNFIELINIRCDNTVPYLAALVGSGFGNMNPTIICIEFIPSDDKNTTLYLSATAKEGLIKQKSAEKAVKNLKILLS